MIVHSVRVKTLDIVFFMSMINLEKKKKKALNDVHLNSKALVTSPLSFALAHSLFSIINCARMFRTPPHDMISRKET